MTHPSDQGAPKHPESPDQAGPQRLKIDRPMPHADDFYEALIDAHKGLNDAQSEALNARLILILANHIGDEQVLKDAIALAAKSRPSP